MPCVHRIPRPTFRDDREAPLSWARDSAGFAIDSDFPQYRAPATDWHDGQFAHAMHDKFSLGLSGKSVIAAQRLWGHAMSRNPFV